MKFVGFLITVVRALVVLLIFVSFSFLTFMYILGDNAGVAVKDFSLSTITDKEKFLNPEPTYMKTGIIPVNQSSDLKVLKKNSVKTCDQLIKVWKPAHLPAGVKVECSKQQLDDVSKNTYGLTFVQSYSDTHFGGYVKIYLREGVSLDHLIDAYNHEAFHAVSYKWSEEKQAAFIEMMGDNSWSKGSYKDRVSERWAWAATSCNGARLKQTQGYENKVPGGCKTVKEWLEK